MGKRFINRFLEAVFFALIRKGISISFYDFIEVAKVLNKGYKADSPESLSNLLELLWIKRQKDITIFHEVIEEVIREFSDEGHYSSKQHPDPASGKKPGTGMEEGSSASEEVSPGISDKPVDISSAPGFNEIIRYLSYQGITKKSDYEGNIPLHIFRDEFDASNEMDKSKAFLLSFNYLPVSPILLRNLFKRPLTGSINKPSKDIDLAKTVEETAKNYIPVKIHYRKKKYANNKLFLLVDQLGSMAYYQPVTENWILEMKRMENLLLNIYSFTDYPKKRYYHGLKRVNWDDEEKLLPQLKDKKIIIFSDGGSLRREFSEIKANRIKDWLKKLKEQTPYLIWINPGPPDRWEDSTAGELLGEIPMFPFTDQGLVDGLSILSGRVTVKENFVL